MPTANPNRGGLLIGLGAFGLFGVLFLMGMHALCFGHFVAQRNVAASQSWVETRCEILEAGVNVHPDSDHGDSYTLYVKFKYEFDRQEYISNRYDFSYMAHSDEAVPQTVVSKLPPGTQTACYVNPDDPSEAVVKREGENTGTLLGAIAVITLGLVGMFLTLIIGMKKNPVEMIGDVVFSAVEKMLDKMDSPADPEQTGADQSDPADDVAGMVAGENDKAVTPPEVASSQDPDECFAKIPASRVVELLRSHGEVRSQQPSAWKGTIPLPEAIASFYREVGPVNITIEGYGSPAFIPSLSELWDLQKGHRADAVHESLWTRTVGKLFNRWDNDWIVVAKEGDDPSFFSIFIYSIRTGKILNAYGMHSRTSWEAREVHPDLNTMAACLAILGSVCVEAGEDFSNDHGIRPKYLARAISLLTDELGNESEAVVIVGAAGWA